jgi:hypothetical protein
LWLDVSSKTGKIRVTNTQERLGRIGMAEEQQSAERDEENDSREATFDDQVQYFARELVLDAQDINDTYKDRPESLKAYFNACSGFEGTAFLLNLGIVVSGVAALVTNTLSALLITAPVTGLGMWCAARHESKKDKIIEQAVRNDVEQYRAAKPQPAPQTPA